MTKVHVSNVCRVEVTTELLDFAKKSGPGVTQIPGGLLAPRQIEVDHRMEIPATLKWHRDTYVPVIDRAMAHVLVSTDRAKYVPQSLLVYKMADYLSDPDVRKDEQEWDNARQAQQDGTGLVIVAVIGESRSPISVCRNIVSGCQKLDTIVDDARGAVESTRTFLIED